VADVPAAYDPENLCVAPRRFRAQVELLLAAGFEFLTVAELTSRMNGGPPPPGLAALSFDDGMENNVSVLLPLLREYGLPATVYVATGLIGQRIHGSTVGPARA
jgi:peptidoglycan/xylan/chitin deacetylase (PgdA/CDA1 family)